MTNARFPAVVAYVPVLGWLYVLLVEQRNQLAMFHVRQSIGLVVFVLASFAVWAVIGWIISWIPYGFLVANALFTFVILAVMYGMVAWVIGVVNASRGRAVLLPVFGRLANRV